MRTLFIAAIPPGYGGAGDYLDIVLKKYKGSLLIYPRVPKGTDIIQKILIKLQLYINNIFVLILLTLKLVDRTVIYHPQSIGFRFTTFILRNSRIIEYYVLDNSFFCQQSYNQINSRECIDCLEIYNARKECVIFPRQQKISEYREFIDEMRHSVEKILFITQTNQQVNLLEARFGGIRFVKNKMIVDSFYRIQAYERKEKTFDFCFHGNLHEAKGYSYTLKLAIELKELSFFIPGKILTDYRKIDNVITRELSWSDGLEAVLNDSKIILCPSVWSAPIEAAVIKSLLLKKPVAIMDSSFGIANEIPKDCVIILKGNIVTDARQLKNLLLNREYLEKLSLRGFEWAKSYIGDKSADIIARF